MKLDFNKNYNGSGVILFKDKEIIKIKELGVKITNIESVCFNSLDPKEKEHIIERVRGKIKRAEINKTNYNELLIKKLKERPSQDTNLDMVVMNIILDDDKGKLKLKDINFRPKLILKQKLCELKDITFDSLNYVLLD